MGVLYIVCQTCKKPLGTRPIADDDPANGMTSHGSCKPCMKKWREENGLPPEEDFTKGGSLPDAGPEDRA